MIHKIPPTQPNTEPKLQKYALASSCVKALLLTPPVVCESKVLGGISCVPGELGEKVDGHSSSMRVMLKVWIDKNRHSTWVAMASGFPGRHKTELSQDWQTPGLILRCPKGPACNI